MTLNIEELTKGTEDLPVEIKIKTRLLACADIVRYYLVNLEYPVKQDKQM